MDTILSSGTCQFCEVLDNFYKKFALPALKYSTDELVHQIVRIALLGQ